MTLSLNCDWNSPLDFTCNIDGDLLRCVITPYRNLTAPTFCCSGMAPLTLVDGGTQTLSLGSQLEATLPDLVAGRAHPLTIRYTGGYTPANRAWMPLGPFLRTADGPIPLPDLPAGATAPDYRDRPAPDGLQVIPQPQSWQATDGHLSVTALSCDLPQWNTVADLFARWEMPLPRAAHGTVINVAAAEMPADGFAIQIAPQGITLQAGDDGGRLYALITLATLWHTHQGRLPCGLLTDAPRFGWRGQHLDCARHFFAVPTILRLLDLMALLRLNRFHWHFADDEAFRLEIDSYPQLWQQTALRGEGKLLPGLFGGGILAGGSYAKSDVARVLEHAAALNIEVLPEIEVPAHAYGLVRVFPETRDPHDNGAEATVQGYTQSAVNPAMPATWDILPRIAEEVAGLFPFGHLHLGCDELAADTWMSSPAARRLMAENDLSDTDDLQGWMMAKLAGHLVQNGIRPAAWEEAAKGVGGGIGNGAILFSWTGQGPGIAAARAGYDVVMTPAQHAYLDMAHTADPDDWGANWAAYVSLADTLNWDPVPPEAKGFADRIIGVQGTFWGEFTTHDDQLWPMLIPRIFGVAVKAWQADDTMTPALLEQLAGSYQRLL